MNPNARRTLTRKELVDLARARFGPSTLDWKFRCPNCGDIATTRDFQDALAAHPQSWPDGDPIVATALIAQECIGRTIGALDNPKWTGRGCSWSAYGLFPGPWTVILESGKRVSSFPLAEPDGTAR